MTTKSFRSVFVFALPVVLSLVFVFAALAATKSDIVYPVQELNNCKTEKECKTYCDNPTNMEACVSFAEKYSLMSKSEVQTAKKFISAGKKGPGGCTSKDSCENYCNDVSHLDECLTFAEKNDFMERGELEEARKVQTALKKGAKLPGGCKNKNSCDSYCNDSSHIEECVTFAEAAGFMAPDELQEAKKVMAAMKNGAKPPPCRGKRECDNYCSDPANLESCLVFAEAAGLMPESELKEAKRALEAVRKGAKIPKCRGKKECDVYCSQPENLEGCLNFAVAAGFMLEKDAEMARKTGGKGPGGCRGEAECKAFCENPENNDVCYQFAVENNLMSEEDLARIEEGKAQMQEALEEAPDEVVSCLMTKLGSGAVEQIRTGTIRPSEKMGNTLKSCFEEFMQSGGGRGFGDDEDFNGSGDFGSEEGYGDEQEGGMPSRDDVMKMLPQNLPDSVRGCVESQLSDEVVSGGKAAIQSLVEDCYAEEMRGGNIFQSAKGFLLRAWDKIRQGR